VMNWAAGHLAARQEIVFARRMVTRAPQPGSDHDPVTQQQFAHLIGSGGLVWRWDAHGYQYGISAHYAAEVAAGRVVVVNGSREHASGLQVSQQVRVVQIVAEIGQLGARLAQRGREAPQEIAHRLARNALFSELRVDHTIVNQGELARAGRQLAAYLEAGAASSAARR
jgi:ribose 1,5-bisphosphokinase